MDEDTRASIADLKTDVRNGFAEMKTEIRDMVTRSEFRATIARVDADTASQRELIAEIRRDFTSHEEAAPGHRAAALARADAVRSEVHEAMRESRVANRWAITLAATGAAILVPAVLWAIERFSSIAPL